MNTPTREEIDAKLAASEARMDARIARIENTLENIAKYQQDTIASNKTTRNTIIVTGVAVVLGIAAFNATVLSNMVASFESGKNTANALAQAAQALEKKSQQEQAKP